MGIFLIGTSEDSATDGVQTTQGNVAIDYYMKSFQRNQDYLGGES